MRRRNAARFGTPFFRGRSGGTSFATGRPCSVITISRPALTSSSRAERFWRASRTPAVRILFIVLHVALHVDGPSPVSPSFGGAAPIQYLFVVMPARRGGSRLAVLTALALLLAPAAARA